MSNKTPASIRLTDEQRNILKKIHASRQRAIDIIIETIKNNKNAFKHLLKGIDDE